MNAGSWVARRRPISEEPSAARHATGPRFERFAAAMQAMPPPSAQVLPEAAEQKGIGPAAGAAAAEPAPAPKPAHLRPAEPVEAEAAPAPKPAHLRPAEPIEAGPVPAAEAATQTADSASTPPMPDVDAAAATVIPRRPIVEDAGRSRADVPWLGIGSWLLLCAALFASLVGWPGQAALDRVTSIWSDVIPSEMLARTPGQDEPTPAQGAPSPADKQGLSAMTPSLGHKQEALPPTELAPPIRSEPTGGTADSPADSPPLPRFKPSLDRVAAKFSNAFLEFGDRLQRQGDFDAALHMRRQGTNLDPSKAPGASNL